MDYYVNQLSEQHEFEKLSSSEKNSEEENQKASKLRKADVEQSSEKDN